MGLIHNIRNYGKTTSFKGIARCAKAPTKTQRVIWFIGAIFGIGYGTFIVYRMISLYLNYDTTVKMHEVRTDDIPFPDVTVCNLNTPSDEILPGFDQTLDTFLENVDSMLHASSIDYDYYIDTIADLKTKRGFLQNRHFDENFDEEMVASCHYFTKDGSFVDCKYGNGYRYVFNSLLASTCVTFSVIHDNFTAEENKKRINNIMALKVEFFLSDFSEVSIENLWVGQGSTNAKGVATVLHQPGTIHPFHTGGSRAGPGFETSQTYDTTLRTILGPPYGKACTDDEFLHPELATGVRYSEIACIELSCQKTIAETCGCMNSWFMFSEKLFETYDFCGKIYDEDIKQTLDDLECLNGNPCNFENITCNPACQVYKFDADFATAPWPHESFQKALYNDLIRDKYYEEKFSIYSEIFEEMETNKTSAFKKLRETDLFRRNFLSLNIQPKNYKTLSIMKDVPSITIFALTGILGGTLNLWMGISFILVIELFDLVIMTFTDKKDKPTLTAVKPISPNHLEEEKKIGYNKDSK